MEEYEGDFEEHEEENPEGQQENEYENEEFEPPQEQPIQFYEGGNHFLFIFNFFIFFYEI